MSNFDFSDDIVKAKEGKTLNKPFRTPVALRSSPFMLRTRRVM